MTINMKNKEDKAEEVVGQIIQNSIRKSLWQVAEEKKLPKGTSCIGLFVEHHISRVLEKLEEQFTIIAEEIEKLAEHLSFPLVKGKTLLEYYFTDSLKNEIIRRTYNNEDYSPSMQILIENVDYD